MVVPAPETPPPTPPRLRGGATIDNKYSQKYKNQLFLLIVRSPLPACGLWCWGWGFLYWHKKDVSAYIHIGKELSPSSVRASGNQPIFTGT
jgi:hypothetical protein